MARFILLALLCLSASFASAQQLALFSDAARPLVSQPVTDDRLERAQTASLFSGRTGLFARQKPPPPEIPDIVARMTPRTGDHRVALLRDLIASAEAGPMGYDAVQYGARRKPRLPPTSMTVGEIFEWIKATPGQPHAIGRYQFIPATLRYLVRDLGVPDTARFNPALQDRLADRLLEQAGLGDFLTGRMHRTVFMNAIARIWAGLPNSSGRSHYHGYAGNKAVISWPVFEAEMAAIFPIPALPAR